MILNIPAPARERYSRLNLFDLFGEMMKCPSLIPILILSLIFVLVSCGPPTAVDISESKPCLPRDLMLEKTANNYALIAWDPGCPGTRIMRGFNIYLSPVPLAKKYPGSELPATIEPFNQEIYPGDTLGNPNRETFECQDIENARAYYAHVRAVYSDNTLSPPTNEIEIITYPQGTIKLGVSYSGNDDGFSFAKSSYCGTDDLENDLYFYHLDGQDFLCSPARIGPVNRKTQIYVGRQDMTIKDIQELVADNKPSEKVQLRRNGVYFLITEDGYPARLRLIDIKGTENDRTAVFEYRYRPPVKTPRGLSS
jgi:hypothetical protein